MAHDIENWKFKFENIFDDDATRDDFGKYMASVHNAEPFQFYVAVENLKRLRSATNQVRAARDIMERFVEPFAPQEINIDKPTRMDILMLVDRLGIWKMEPSSSAQSASSASTMSKKDHHHHHRNDRHGSVDVDMTMEQQRELSHVLGKAQNIVFREMKEDNFPRYLRSKQFAKFIKSRPSTMERIASRRVLSEKETRRELPEDLGTYHARVRESDFELLQELEQDSTYGWKLLSDSKKTGIAVYLSKFDIVAPSPNDSEVNRRSGSDLSSTASDGSTGSLSDNSSTSSAKSGYFFKSVATIKQSYHVVCSTLTDPTMRTRVDQSLVNSTPVEFLHATDDSEDRAYSSVVVCQSMRISNFIKPRTMVSHISLKHIPEMKRYVVAIKSTKNKKADTMLSMDKSTPLTVFGGQILQKIDDHTTRYTTLFYLNVGRGILNEFPMLAEHAVKFLGTRRARKMHRNLEKFSAKMADIVGDTDEMVSLGLDSANLVRQSMLDSETAFSKLNISKNGVESEDLDTDSESESTGST